MRCPVCPVSHVPNSIFCDECGAYLPKGKELGTHPLDVTQIKWLGEDKGSQAKEIALRDLAKTRTIRLRIGSAKENGSLIRELQISLAKPVRLGRNDPKHDIFPEVDLTQDLAREHGVSREHTCIFQQGNTVKLEDLGSTNGTLLNGKRLDPYIAEALRDGDQFQMGKMLIEVSFES